MLRNKLPGKGTNIFTVMSNMAQAHGAINLAQGFPDFDGPQALRKRVAYHIAHGHNQYAPLAGVPFLREQTIGAVDKLTSRYIAGCVEKFVSVCFCLSVGFEREWGNRKSFTGVDVHFFGYYPFVTLFQLNYDKR